MHQSYVKPHFLPSPCPLHKGAIFTFRHRNGYVAVDIVESIDKTGPFITSQCYGTLHRENLTRRHVIFVDDFPAQPGDKIVYNDVLYKCDKTFSTKYHASRGKTSFVIPHKDSHRVRFSIRDVVQTFTTDDLFEMYRGRQVGDGKPLSWKVWDAGLNKYELERCIR